MQCMDNTLQLSCPCCNCTLQLEPPGLSLVSVACKAVTLITDQSLEVLALPQLAWGSRGLRSADNG